MDRRLRNLLHPKKPSVTEYVTQKQFAKMLGICVPTFLKYERTGQIPRSDGVGHKKLKLWLRKSVMDYMSTI